MLNMILTGKQFLVSKLSHTTFIAICLKQTQTDQDACHVLTCLTESCCDGDAAVAWPHDNHGGCELA